MTLKRFSIGTLGLLAVSGFAWSCSSKSEDCNANLNCAPYAGETGASGASGAGNASGSAGTSGSVGGGNGKGGGSSSGSGNGGDGGTDSSAGSGGALPPTCDGTLGPDVEDCVISDEYGVFVGPTGMDASADGTQAHPYATVTAALAGISKIKHVYVCAGDYLEPDTLQIPDRVSIYGGFTCEGGAWKYDSAVPAHLISASPIGAMITNAKVGVVIQDLRLDAANAPVSTVGGSSFGLMIDASQGVVLRRVEIRAGKATGGKDGSAGQAAADGLAPTAAQNGSDACASMVVAGMASTESSCGSKGGNGGLGYLAASGDPGLTGVPTMNLIAPFQPNGGPGASQDGVAGTIGGSGLYGKAGENGAAAAAIGTFTASGYQVASGGDGTNGYPGQAGGGGGASKGKASCAGASGGAGGMGGCGGKAGAGGSGGGASVAVLSWNSTVTIDGSKLVASSGGAGANGGSASAGGSGAAGGAGGKANATEGVAKGGNGNDGGLGGNGGNGAGGSGGPSIALFWSGTRPVQVGATQFTPGEGGKAGAGGRLGSDSDKWAPDGKAGVSEAIFPKDTP